MLSWSLCLFLQVVAAIEWGPNPIINDQPDLADPCVMEFNGTLYLYPTSNQASYEVYTRSLTDPGATNWTRAGVVFKSDMFCPFALAPGVGNHSLVWAPHVMHDSASGKFYLYYTVCMSVGVAVSDSPLGPFKKVRTLVNMAIDAYAMRDADGQLYLYYAKLWEPVPLLFSKDHYAESIYGRRLLSPTELASEAAVHLIHPDQEWWEFNKSMTGPLARFLTGINEGPWVTKHGSTYYLTYSGAAANSEFYRIGYATSTHPLGPFVKASQGLNPIIRPADPSPMGIYGPGHHSVWRDSSTGRSWAIYHIQKSTATGWGRMLCVDELFMDESTGAITVNVSLGQRSSSGKNAPRQSNVLV